MYTLTIDIERQRFVIEDRAGSVIAVRDMPAQQYPNPGRETLMNSKSNLGTWQAMEKLVEMANKGTAR